MRDSTIKIIDAFFEKNPIAKGISASEKEIRKAEKELKIQFDSDYISFQLRYGGSMIGAKEIYGFHNSELMEEDNIVELTKSYRENEDNCSMDWLIIGTDYSANSIGINREGNVVKYDHDFGEYSVLANTFEQYILDEFQE
jgi:hypothetical protein